MNALGLAAEGYGLERPDFMARVARIVHGTTVSTNALLGRQARDRRADLHPRLP